LIVVSDCAHEDAQTAVSLAYNSGLAVKVVDKDGIEVGTVSAVPAVEEVPAVDEPHPVLEKEVPPVEPAPVVAPEVVVSESSP